MLRRKYVALTPEEEVRQRFVSYLLEKKGFPKELLANEVELSIGNKNLRCDTVAYNTSLQPIVIVEYKKPEVKLSQKVFNQLLDYNSILKVKYLVMTNGTEMLCCRLGDGKYEFVSDVPEWGEISKDLK